MLRTPFVDDDDVDDEQNANNSPATRTAAAPDGRRGSVIIWGRVNYTDSRVRPAGLGSTDADDNEPDACPSGLPPLRLTTAMLVRPSVP